MSTSLTDAWSQYWRQSRRHSASVGDADRTVAPVVRQFWRARLSAFDAKSVVLNIGAGNGSIERDAITLENALSFESVDLADIAPDWLQHLSPAEQSRIRFHAATPAEQLPFVAGGMDAAISQFALEYCDVDRALKEWTRCAKAEAPVIALVHDRDSIITAASATEIAHYDWLLGQDSPLTAALPLLPLVQRAATPEGRRALGADPVARRSREQYNQAVQGLQSRATASLMPDVLMIAMHDVHTVLSTANTTALALSLDALNTIRRNIEFAAARAREQSRVAMDAPAAEALVARAKACGIALQSPYQLMSDKGSIAWVFEGRVTQE